MNMQEHVMGDCMAEFQKKLGPQWERARDALKMGNQRAMAMMREYPGASILVAIGMGFLVGRIASRRR